MISALLEENICRALDMAVGAMAPGMARNPVVRGVWREAGRAAKGPELKPVGVAIDVSVAPPAFGRFEVNKADFACSAAVRFKSASAQAAGNAVMPVCEAVSAQLFTWQMDREAIKSDLGSDGLEPFDFSASGGEPPVFDGAADEWSVVFRFTVAAVVVG